MDSIKIIVLGSTTNLLPKFMIREIPNVKLGNNIGNQSIEVEDIKISNDARLQENENDGVSTDPLINSNITPSGDWDDPDEENSKAPHWVEGNIKLGAYGQKVAQRFYFDQGYLVENVSANSRLGYDLVLYRSNKSYYCEVKTAYYTNRFFISSNELSLAKSKGDNYLVFFIRVFEKEGQMSGYILQNPVKKLGIPVDELLSPRDNSKIRFSLASLKIEVTEQFINSLSDQEKVVNLIHWG